MGSQVRWGWHHNCSIEGMKVQDTNLLNATLLNLLNFACFSFFAFSRCLVHDPQRAHQNYPSRGEALEEMSGAFLVTIEKQLSGRVGRGGTRWNIFKAPLTSSEPIICDVCCSNFRKFLPFQMVMGSSIGVSLMSRNLHGRVFRLTAPHTPILFEPMCVQIAADGKATFDHSLSVKV